MELPTIIGAAVVAAVLIAIIVRGIVRRRRGKGGCGCGCDSCPSAGICHPKQDTH